MFPLIIIPWQPKAEDDDGYDCSSLSVRRKSMVPDRRWSKASHRDTPEEIEAVRPFSRTDILYNRNVDKLAMMFEEDIAEQGLPLFPLPYILI